MPECEWQWVKGDDVVNNLEENVISFLFMYKQVPDMWKKQKLFHI